VEDAVAEMADDVAESSLYSLSVKVTLFVLLIAE
jgi:hypothetical protein